MEKTTMNTNQANAPASLTAEIGPYKIKPFARPDDGSSAPSVLDLERIRMDGGTQARVQINQVTVSEYAEAMRDGALFPPVEVFHDGQAHWLADGFHRVLAAQEAGLVSIRANVREGSQRDARLYAAGANAAHGLRRSNADKQQAVQLLLADAEWRTWSDREIARRCGVHHQMVGKLRAEASLDDSSSERTYTTRHGTVAVMDVSKIGAKAGE
jgi:uncharacterized ParB-like nuclease family protein